MSDADNRTLVVLAHPDDPEFFCGGTLAKWARAGRHIRYLLLTCGDKGSDAPEVTPELLCADRKAEQRAAADVLGVREVRFLDFPDGELTNSREVRREIVREIRAFQPAVLVTSDPSTFIRLNISINHPDHRAAGAAVLDAVFPAAGNRMYFPELLEAGLAPFMPREVWLSIPDQPNHWVDVTDTIQSKIAALREHKSQIKDPEQLEARIRDRLRRPDIEGEFYAEAFRVIRFAT